MMMMKFFWTLTVFLLAIAAVLVRAQGECDQICDERSAALAAEKDALWREKEELLRDRDAVIRDKDEIWQHRERIIQEKDNIWHEKERVLQDFQRVREELDEAVRARDEVKQSMESMHLEKGGVLAEVEQLRKSLETVREDMLHYQKVAQDNQKYMQEYKNQLHTQRDRVAKTDEALKEANAKIEELESTTFINKLQKEIANAWKAIIEYWTNVRSKGKSEGNGEF